MFDPLVKHTWRFRIHSFTKICVEFPHSFMTTLFDEFKLLHRELLDALIQIFESRDLLHYVTVLHSYSKTLDKLTNCLRSQYSNTMFLPNFVVIATYSFLPNPDRFVIGRLVSKAWCSALTSLESVRFYESCYLYNTMRTKIRERTNDSPSRLLTSATVWAQVFPEKLVTYDSRTNIKKTRDRKTIYLLAINSNCGVECFSFSQTARMTLVSLSNRKMRVLRQEFQVGADSGRLNRGLPCRNLCLTNQRLIQVNNNHSVLQSLHLQSHVYTKCQLHIHDEQDQKGKFIMLRAIDDEFILLLYQDVVKGALYFRLFNNHTLLLIKQVECLDANWFERIRNCSLSKELFAIHGATKVMIFSSQTWEKLFVQEIPGLQQLEVFQENILFTLQNQKSIMMGKLLTQKHVVTSR